MDMRIASIALLTGLALSAGALPAGAAEPEKAVFAGGCFWCMEEAYEAVEGVSAVVSGYEGGTVDNPTYEQVSGGETGHYEVVEVEYDPDVVTYEQLLDVFWKNVDPYDDRGQFCDKGSQYLSAVFYGNDEERQLAEASRAKIAADSGQSVVTEILPDTRFYPAEEYHQDFYRTNEARYKYYKFACGRAQRLEEIWGEPAA
jgi:peptide-methionine (S)-S-oxide reductase